MYAVYWRGSVGSIGYGEVENQTDQLLKFKQKGFGGGNFCAYHRQVNKRDAILVLDTEAEAVAACERIDDLIKRHGVEAIALRSRHSTELSTLITEMRQP